ncbi:hypothetical protein PAECIP111891_06998 [Paenibacillus allorhizoplanae]|uniref:Uncharacterized protein n=1 Tax=Paenibacillus allorhizoplanae TaxID=2905648 RepID=A0ABM9CZ54_9BACL|nr:hypothetical protein PAECIP111891_06998 [Paenibacillus allorhizoplanae]
MKKGYILIIVFILLLGITYLMIYKPWEQNCDFGSMKGPKAVYDKFRSGELKCPENP